MIYLNKQNNTFCFISSIDKKNKVLMYHWKYFGYHTPKKIIDLNYTITLKKFVNIKYSHLISFFQKNNMNNVF